MPVQIVVPKPHSDIQSQIMNAFHLPGLVEMWIACGTKFGKAVTYDEYIPTLTGWKRMFELKEGDYVFDENGKPTRITFITDLMVGHNCCRVKFSDDSTVDCDEDHWWVTETHSERKNKARVISQNDRTKSTESKPTKRTTLEIAKTITIDIGDGRVRPNHSIPTVAGPIQYPHMEVSLDPYVLGVWLGDGSRNLSQITTHDNEILEEIKKAGFEVNALTCEHRFGIPSLITELKKLGLGSEKFVPKSYLISSPKQRLSLLQGLMDTDGTISKDGHCCFDNTNKNIAYSVKELAESFGIKCTENRRIGKLYGVEHKLCYRICFATDLPVFRVSRKLARLRKTALKATKRYIVGVERIATRPVLCIRVDNPTHLFLVGKNFIPTHNTLGLSSALVSAAPLRPQTLWRWIAPIYPQTRIGMRYIQRMMPKDHIKVNRADMTIEMPAIDSIIQFFHGQHPSSLEGEASSGNVLDECAKMKHDVYASVKTTVTVTRGIIVGISTPLGKNWFWEKCMEAQEEMRRAYKEKRQPKKIFITAPTSANPFVMKEAIEEARRSLPARLFEQYYLAKFVDDSEVFCGFRECLYGDHIEMMNQAYQMYVIPDLATDANDRYKVSVIIGADWGKITDFTVFTVWDYVNRRLIGFMRFKGEDYVNSIRNLVDFADKFSFVEMVYHDQTGLGEPINDLLSRTELPYEGVTFSNKTKAAMVNIMIMGIQTRTVKLLNWFEMIKELDAYEVTTTEIGVMRYSAPNGMNDDIVSSMILGYAGMTEYSDQSFDVKIMEELGTSNSENLARRLREDDEDNEPGWLEVKI